MNAVSLKKNARFLQIDRKEWVIHLIFWILLIASAAVTGSWTRIFPDKGVVFIITTLIIPFYINALLLIPRYLKRTKWAKYILLLAALLLAVYAVKALLLVLSMELRGLNYDFAAEFSKWLFRDFRDLHRFIFSSTTQVVLWSFAYRLVKDWMISERVKDKLISEKLSMELALLKSQVNPHFLFNTLNNIYAMALEEKADRTADGVAKMGTLMRYSLHEAQADFIPLQRELDYLVQYVEMQKLRIPEEGKLRVHINLAGLEVSSKKIAPMILVPFIENAFKYGVSTVEESSIHIDIKLSGSVLSVHVKNMIHPDHKAVHGGLGLNNITNRLKLTYPENYKLICGPRDSHYIVELEIKLK